MHNPLTLKLERQCGLGATDHEGLTFGQPSFVSAHEDILSEGQTVSYAKVVLSGIACHTKTMSDGRRAITAFLLPGDFTNHQMPERQRLDFAVEALTACKLVDVPLASWRKPGTGAFAEALLLSMMTDISIQRAWLANLSQQPADKRMAHLLCEFRHRLALVGLADNGGFRLPLVQQDLADALGLSVVHVNRVLQFLKESGLISIRDRNFLIPDLERLENFAEFDPAYLHLEGMGLLPAVPVPEVPK